MAGLQASLGRGQWGLSDQPEPHRGLDPGVVGLFAFLPVLTLSYSESRCKLEAEGTAPGGTGPTSGCLVLTYAQQNICVENNPISQSGSLRPREQ